MNVPHYFVCLLLSSASELALADFVTYFKVLLAGNRERKHEQTLKRKHLKRN